MGSRSHPRLWVLSGALALSLFGSACPGPEYPKCETDDHCKKDKDGKAIAEYCLFGQCQECAKTEHCDSGEKCVSGRCEETCTSDAACGAGNICQNDKCVAAQCTDAKPCGAGRECRTGRCMTTTSTPSGVPATATQPLTCEKKGRVQFDFNVSDIRDDARATLESFAKCMQTNADWRLTVEGHCDERGTTDYNLQLGERRAGSIRDYLVRLGVDRARIRTLSYGEEKPLDSASTEDAWAKNRRGELVVP